MYHTQYLQYNISSNYSSIPYNNSELLALSLGYEEVADSKAYNQRYFILNGKKWIQNLEALRHKLNAQHGRYITDEELEASEPEGFGYDVEAYYSHYQPALRNIAYTTAFQSLIDQVKMRH